MNRQMERERWILLHNVIRTLEPALAILGIAWMVLLVIDLKNRPFLDSAAARPTGTISGYGAIVGIRVQPEPAEYTSGGESGAGLFPPPPESLQKVGRFERIGVDVSGSGRTAPNTAISTN